MSGTFGGEAVPIEIINAWSDDDGAASIAAKFTGAKEILSGALTADTYAEILDVTGRGVITGLSVIRKDATSRAIGCKVIIDGTTVFDASDAAVGDGNNGMVIIGMRADGANGFWSVPFNTSLSISVKSTISETDKVALNIFYYLT